ncbi:MAG: hypothetical protein AVO33_02955 [delta proteobacterium ML8_F1]|nr:MAG: hypothetical protein AVO33_02955 [delta proteobacterium ML8_F1]
MERSKILIIVSTLIYPFLLMFGTYLILNGDLSPGGGFQGGVLFATSFFIRYLLSSKDPFNLVLLARFEKLLYLLLLLIGSVSLLIHQRFFTNFLVGNPWIAPRFFLVLLNFIIGFKVTLGVISIISSFVEEGEL